mgnify:CR=1 FL=1
MHKRDVTVAWAFVIGMWFSVIFVALATWGLAPSGAARTVLLCAGAVILLFNTAAILAMLPPAVVVILMQRWFVKGLVDTEK